MNLLESLAQAPKEPRVVNIEIVKGESLDFNAPLEDDLKLAQRDAEQESEHYYKEGIQLTVQQQEWVPKSKDIFIKATVLSKFLISEEKPNNTRRLFCRIGKHRGITFNTIYDTWIRESILSEIKDFAEEVESLKNSLSATQSDTAD